jgi:tetratricopeptide (TPR) repeat protein
MGILPPRENERQESVELGYSHCGIMPRMSDSNQLDLSPEDTQTSPVAELSNGEETALSKRRRFLFAFLVYVAAMSIIGAIAFLQGRNINTETQDAAVSQALYEQFELGLGDLEAGRFELAKQRFEAVISYDPAYPGAEDMLVEALVNLNVPTVTPTSLPTPTPDPSPPDQILAQAEIAITESDWDTAINKLLALRAKDPTFEITRVDGLMYIALRSLGMDLISSGLMEEGLYNLSLAARFGPLDRDALFRETLARQYILANSYIGLNWSRAADLFGPLCEQGATLDSCPKYGEAAWSYGEQLKDADDICGAAEYFTASLAAWPNSDLEEEAEDAVEDCEESRRPPPTATPEFTPTPTPTPDGNGGGNGNGG